METIRTEVHQLPKEPELKQGSPQTPINHNPVTSHIQAPQDSSAFKASGKKIAHQSYGSFREEGAPWSTRDTISTLGVVASVVGALFTGGLSLLGLVPSLGGFYNRSGGFKNRRFAMLDPNKLNEFVQKHAKKGEDLSRFMSAATPEARAEAFDQFYENHSNIAAVRNMNVNEFFPDTKGPEATTSHASQPSPEQTAAQAVRPLPPKPSIQTTHIPEVLKEAHAKVTTDFIALETATKNLSDAEKKQLNQQSAADPNEPTNLTAAREKLAMFKNSLGELQKARNAVFESIVEGDKDLTEEQTETLDGLSESAATDLRYSTVLQDDNISILTNSSIKKCSDAKGNIDLYRMRTQRTKVDELFNRHKQSITNLKEDYYNANKSSIDQTRGEMGIPLDMAEESLKKGDWDKIKNKKTLQEETRELSQELEILSAKNKKVASKNQTDSETTSFLSASHRLENEIITHLKHGDNRTGKGLDQATREKQDNRQKELETLVTASSTQQQNL